VKIIKYSFVERRYNSIISFCRGKCQRSPFNTQADSYSKNHKVHARWDLMFEKLKEYKQEHGNYLVPNRYEKDRSLGSWVSTPRRYFKLMGSSKCSNERQKFHIDKNRIAKLQDIGFNWVAIDPRRTPWETRFRELCEYKEQFGKSFKNTNIIESFSVYLIICKCF
jgi:Helicase associated domain